MKKLLTFTTAALLTACLVGCGSLNQKANAGVSDEGTSTVAETKSSLILPKIAGVTITSNLANPVIGEYVELTVTVQNASQKRVESVSVDGQVLEAKEINGNTRKYGFVMHAENASVDVVAVTLYAISVAEDVADKFALFGIEGNVAAEGDVVEFAPTTLPGFWFYGVAPVDEDVTIAPVEGKAGWFSFTMPGHAVSFTSTVGKNLYKLGFNSTKVMLGEEEIEVWSASGVTPNKYYEYGEELRFRIYDQSQSYKVSGLKMDGVDMASDESGWYSFTMPAYDLNLEVTYNPWYRNIVVGEVDSAYTLTLKTVVNGEEVEVTDSNVVAKQEVRAYVTSTLDDPHYSPKFTFKTGGTAEGASASTTMSVTYDAEGGYYKFSAVSLDYTQVNITNEYHIIASDTVVGEYEAGMRGYYGGNFYAKINESGEFLYSTGSVASGATPSYSSTTYPISFPDPNDISYGQGINASTVKDIYFGEDKMVVVDGTSRSAAYLYVRGKGNNAVSTSDGGTVSYMYYSTKDSKLETEFFHMTLTNGDVVTAFLDAVNKHVYWDVTATVIEGSDGFTKDDKIVIKDANGALLAYYSFNSKDSYSNGYQHSVASTPLDGLQGTYAPASEDDGTANIVITGYGKATIGDTEYEYVVDNGVLVLSLGETELYYRLNSEDMTYVVSAAPTDTFEGTYVGVSEELTESLVLDGYGNYTLGEETGTYSISKGIISLTSGDVVKNYVLDVESKTYDVVPPYTITLGEYTFVDDGENGYKSNNQSKNSTSASYKLTVSQAVTVTIKFKVSSETNWDYFYIKKNDTDLWTRTEANCSGTSMTEVEKSYDLNPGDTLEFIYYKDGSGDGGSDDTAWITYLSVGESVLIGA